MQRLVRPIVDSIRGPPSFAFPIDSLLHALVDDERLRTGFGLELRGPLLPFGVEADLQHVSANLVDAQDDRPFVRPSVTFASRVLWLCRERRFRRGTCPDNRGSFAWRSALPAANRRRALPGVGRACAFARVQSEHIRSDRPKAPNYRVGRPRPFEQGDCTVPANWLLKMSFCSLPRDVTW